MSAVVSTRPETTTAEDTLKQKSRDAGVISGGHLVARALKALMLTVKAWSIANTKDRNAQLNTRGDLHILEAEANIRYCGQIVWAY